MLNKPLLDIKKEIQDTIELIDKAYGYKRKKQLIKHKHRLEKEVMTYMYLRYGVIMRKDKSR